MADTFGALTLPAAVPGTDDGEGYTPAAAGDPCLDTLLAFFSAVLIADVGDAWAERAPGTNEQPIVRAVFTHDPVENEFREALLPALFLWRPGEGAGVDEYAEDLLRDASTLRLWWVMPYAPDGDVQRQRMPLLNAVSKAIARACNAGRHPAWALAADSTADPDAIRLATTNTTGAVTWSGVGLNGVVGGGSVFAGRAVTVTSSASAGAFNTTDPIEVTGLLAGDVEHTESIYLTAANGGQTRTGIWLFESVTSVTRPAQTLAAGTLSIGYAASPEAPLGSLVKRAANLSKLNATTTKRRRFEIEDAAGERMGPFFAVEMAIAVEEIEDDDLDAAVTAGTLTNIAAGTYGAQITVTNEEGETMSVGDLPNQ
jgi:hypothetical protein